MLLLLPQRYIFSSKSQRIEAEKSIDYRCCCYHKGTYFQANHNTYHLKKKSYELLLLPQRYIFSSKSQPLQSIANSCDGCCCYHKGTYFQANHNRIFIGSIFFVLLLLPQRYIFSGKTQLLRLIY